MHTGDKLASVLHTIYTPGAGGFLHKVLNDWKMSSPMRVFFHEQ